LQKGSLFVVGVDFDILVGDLLFFECHPDALDEATKVAYVSDSLQRDASTWLWERPGDIGRML
jgi:hypothetical protein